MDLHRLIEQDYGKIEASETRKIAGTTYRRFRLRNGGTVATPIDRCDIEDQSSETFPPVAA